MLELSFNAIITEASAITLSSQEKSKFNDSNVKILKLIWHTCSYSSLQDSIIIDSMG